MDIILDCIKDTVVLFPTIFVIYLILEWVEEKEWNIKRFSKFGPLAGAVVGLLPECGTSIMASRLFSAGTITLGTLFAVFVSSSDEAIIVLLSGSRFSLDILYLLCLKLIYGVIFGLLVDRMIHLKTKPIALWVEEQESHHKLKHALMHTIKIMFFVFVSQIIIALMVAIISEDTIEIFLNTHLYLQPIVAGLIGLIPNCAGSIILAQTYLNGMLSFGALFAGLSCSTGLGLLTLYRYYPNKKECLWITLLIYLVSVFVGYVVL